MIWLAIAIVLASAVSAFFYLRVVAAMYFSESPVSAEEPSRTPMLGFSVMAMVVGTIVFGVFSGQIADIANRWVQAFSISM
jgi:NADH-quinone oxidoreductase subunit N